MSLKSVPYPVGLVSETVVRYIGNNFISSDNCSVRSVVNSIYNPESIVWKDYIKKYIECAQNQKDFIHCTAQSEFFDAIFDLHHDPRLTISACLSMMKDIYRVIEKCRADGTYSEVQAFAISYILVNDFYRTVDICYILKAEYEKNKQAVDFCANRRFQFETLPFLFEKHENKSECSSNANKKGIIVLYIVCGLCILFGIIGFLQKIWWMLFVFFLFVGCVAWGLYSEVISPKITKALTPNPNWDEETTKRFNNLSGWLIILFIIVVVFVLNKLGIFGDVSRLFKAYW